MWKHLGNFDFIVSGDAEVESFDVGDLWGRCSMSGRSASHNGMSPTSTSATSGACEGTPTCRE